MQMQIEDNEISSILFNGNPDGNLFPEKDLPVNSRKLDGFFWREDERPYSVDDLFDEDDMFPVLPEIRGIDKPMIDVDALESQKETSVQ